MNDAGEVVGMEKDVAVALSFDFDAYSLWIGSFDSASPSMISRGEFGPEGVRRILKTLQTCDITATFFVPGHTTLAFPNTLKMIRDAGHEIGHHGWVHENPATLTPSQERDVMQRGFDALERTVGVRPVGYRSPAWDISAETIPLLIENGFEYDSSMMGSDFQPYWCRIGDRAVKTEAWEFGRPVDLVELPVAWCLDDFPNFEYYFGRLGTLQNTQTPRAVLEMWKDEFDYLYRAVGSGIFLPTMHPQVIGRGHRMLLLEGIIAHTIGKPGVRFTRCSDYVRRWRAGKKPSLPLDGAN